MFDIQLFNPDFVIYCSDFRAPKKIYTIMRQQKIKRAYVYGMGFMPEKLRFDFLKVGRSCPNLGELREHQIGERLVRQVAWVPGWDCEDVKSSHGYDFMHGINTVAIPHNIVPADFNKNMLCVGVWNISSRMHQSDFLSTDEELAASCWAEASLASQYKTHFGKLPVLNVQDPSTNKVFTKPRINKHTYQNSFTEI